VIAIDRQRVDKYYARKVAAKRVEDDIHQSATDRERGGAVDGSTFGPGDKITERARKRPLVVPRRKIS
jgi:hypothetical protein